MFAPHPYGWAFALLIVFFARIQFSHVRDSERLFVESFRMQRRNMDLVAQLSREQAATQIARVKAEQANGAKSRFLAAASHDLRQPLFSLSLNSAALGFAAKDDQIRLLAARIEAGITAMSALLDGLLDASRLDADLWQPEFGPVDVSALAQRVAAEFKPATDRKGLAFELTVDAGVCARSDPSMLERILRNLLDNAVKHTASGSVALAVGRAGDRAEICITDTGPGIPAAEQERVFEAFYQLDNPGRDRRKGVGLGLSIVRRLSELLGVTLRLDSAPGTGTRFCLSLPAGQAPLPADALAAAAVPTVHAAQPRHVLVIEDDRDVREGLATLLQQAGYSVAVAADGAQALALAGARRPQAIVADFMLGETTGTAVAVDLRRRLGDIPVLVVNGNTGAEPLRAARAHGFALLHKPVQGNELIAAIDKLLAPDRVEP